MSRTTYEALVCGSRNHLRAYVGQLEDRGTTYEAAYISAEALTEILEADQEPCGDGSGSGMGEGQRRGKGARDGSGMGPRDGSGPGKLGPR
ncbi:MAG: DUF2202 domain-containing protein [Deltaproteobacteria bacterium]|nr:DUF2202 domain-containing protein [Deltaproteobacteria bacterium]MBW2255269.1 DUF2202 domain-containing protein [Deltaproteobacteria bacterium]